MKGNPLRILGAVAGLALAACAGAVLPAGEADMPTTNAGSTFKMMPAREWPLRFHSHKFGVYTYDTYGARVVYAGQVQLDEDAEILQKSSASYGPDYRRSWNGIHGMIRNFPPPAEVTWRSKDGAPHEARIDFEEIFEDEVVRHSVPRQEMADLPDGRYEHEPAIVLEVNDRIARVYMKAFIPTKEPQMSGAPRSDARYELVLVRSYDP